MAYKLTHTTDIIRLIDGAIIPANTNNIDYQEYLSWVEKGNSAQKADAPLSALIRDANMALIHTDVVAFRCFKAGMPYPPSWAIYTSNLRAIINGSDTTSTSLPLKPPYPIGT